MIESQIFTPMIELMATRGHDIYCDPLLTIKGSDTPPDLVIAHNPPSAPQWITIVEGKLRLNEDLICQCARWVGYANQVYGLVLSPKRRSRAHNERRKELGDLGIGLAYAVGTAGNLEIDWQFGPHVSPNPDSGVILAQLSELQKETEAGMAGGKRIRADRWGPLRSFLKKNPGSMMLNIKHGLDEYNRHDRREIIRLTNRDELPGVRKTHDGKYYTETLK